MRPADRRAEGLIHLALNGDHDEPLVSPHEREHVCLAWALATRKIDLILRDGEKDLEIGEPWVADGR